MKPSLIFVCALSLTAAPVAAATIAKMATEELSDEQLKGLIHQQPVEARAQIVSDPQALDRIIRTELIRRVVYAEAKAANWDQQPEIAKRIQAASEQVVVSSYVNNLARPDASYPSEQEILEFYNGNTDRFQVPKRYRVAQIYVAGASKHSEIKAGDLARRAKVSDADFAALAKANSDHAESAQNGGDMGWIGENNLVPEIRDAVSALKPGAVSNPVKAKEGWHVLKLIDSAPAGVATLDQVRPLIIEALRIRRAAQIERAYLDGLVAKQPLTIDAAEVEKLRRSLLKNDPQ